jgi:hypothetical protein
MREYYAQYVIDGNPDIGAYQYSQDPSDIITTPDEISFLDRQQVDYNCDDKIDVYDFGILMSCWGEYDPNCAIDARQNCELVIEVSLDGEIVGAAELGKMMSNWGRQDYVKQSFLANLEG